MILSIVLKNLKILIRNRFTLLMLVLAPILLMAIVGYTYSGTVLSGVEVGLIELDENENIFSLRGLEFEYYNRGDTTSSIVSCRDDLVDSKVDICVYFVPEYNPEGDMVSASTIYYTDNTRVTMTNILINNMNMIIDEKTNEITTKTVEDIFDEMKATVDFLEESGNLTDEIYEDLKLARTGLDEFEAELVNIEREFNSNYDDIVELKNELSEELEWIDETFDSLNYNLEETSDSLRSFDKGLERGIDDLEDLREDIKEYGTEVDAHIYNYVSLNSIDNLIYDMSVIKSSTANLKSMVDESKSDLEESSDYTEINDMFDEIEKQLSDGKVYVSEMKDELDVLSLSLDERIEQVGEVREGINEKSDYFNELANNEASSITNPISTKIEPWFIDFKRIHQLTPVVIVLILLFIGLLLSNVIVSMEINSKAYFRNIISPVSQTKFIIALFLTSLIVILFQVMFLFIILNLTFKIPIYSNLGHLLLVIAESLFVFILIGILLAYWFDSIQISVLMTTFVMLFMFLLSDIIVPLEVMPSSFSYILGMSPVIMSENMIRMIIFFDNPNVGVFNHLMFYPYIIVLWVLILAVSYRRKKKLF